MVEHDLQLQAADGVSDAVFLHPDGSGSWPGTLFYTDIGGIRDAYRESARRLAGEGYAVLMPNVFYRTGKPPMFSFRPNFGDERTTKRLAEISGPLTHEAQERDIAAYIDFLTGLEAVNKGPIAVVGYCMTGAMAVRTAATHPDKVAAAASFHGGGLYTDKPASPHLLLPRIKAQLYFGHAVEDRSMTQAAIDQLNEALKTWGGKYQSEVYDGAYHSWTTLDSPVYNKPQAERAFSKLAELFSATLK